MGHDVQALPAGAVHNGDAAGMGHTAELGTQGEGEAGVGLWFPHLGTHAVVGEIPPETCQELSADSTRCHSPCLFLFFFFFLL